MALHKQMNKRNVVVIVSVCILTILFSVFLLTRNFLIKPAIAKNSSSNTENSSDTRSNPLPLSYKEEDNKLLSELKIVPISDSVSLKAMNIRINDSLITSKIKTIKALNEEMNASLDYAKSLGLNAVVIDVTPFAQAIYPSKKLNRSSYISSLQDLTPEYDLFNQVIKSAKERNLKVIASISPLLVRTEKMNADSFKAAFPNLTLTLSGGAVYYNPSFREVRELIKEICKEVASYDIYGIVLEDIAYPSKEIEDNLSFAKYGEGLTTEEFRRRNIDLIVADCISTIKGVNAQLLAGVTSYGVWDTKASQEKGLDITAEKTSYNDYYANSLNWIEKGYIDFIVPKLEWSLENKTTPLKTLFDWWTEKVKGTGIKLFVSQAAYKVGTKETGYDSIAQLSKQYEFMRSNAQYNGSIFDNYIALKANKNSTDALSLLFKGLLDFSTISNTLLITEPKNNITTDLENITIRGACDNNFPLTMDGKTIKPTGKGAFAVDVKLKAGLNTFKFSHKGQTQTFKITYKVVVLKEISPTSDTALNGGSVLNVSVTAHKGSVVSGTFGGKKSTFVEVVEENKETNNANSEFVKYSCSFTMPDATTQVQSLGEVSVVATYNGFTETRKTGKISVKKLDITQTQLMAEVISEYAQCYDNAMTTNNSSPNYFFLPKGTKDRIVGEVDDWDSGQYIPLWVLASGQKVRKYAVKSYQSEEVLSNNITSANALNTEKATIITFEGCKNAVYRGEFVDIYKADAYKTSSFNTTFDATTFKFRLYYSPNAPDINNLNSQVFSSVSKAKVDETTYEYTFTLREKGKFYGFLVDYDLNGNMIIKINNPIKLSSDPDKPLKGIKIMIDPGHGANGSPYGAACPDEGTFGKNAPDEKDLNLIVSLKLKEKLLELGAEVVMIRETDVAVDNGQRVVEAWKQQPDLYISMHHDGSVNSTVSGPSVLYFYGFNSDLSDKIFNKLSQLYSHSVSFRSYYKSIQVLRNQAPMAILIECGFLSNPTEYEWLCEAETAPKFAKAIADGILEYFK